MKVLLFLVLFIFVSPSFAQSLEEGKQEFLAQNFEAAFKILKPLADQGHEQALTYIAHMYFEGLGVIEDIELGCDIFEKAAQMGVAEAQSYAGLCYSSPTPGRAPNPHRAYNWLKMGYEGGFKKHQDILGVNAYHVGDYKLSYKLILPLAQNGHHQAMFLIGALYRDGKHVEQNYDLACDWFEKATQGETKEAFYDLAVCYYLGEGRPLDKETAFKHFKKSAALGDLDAAKEVEKMEKMGFGH